VLDWLVLVLRVGTDRRHRKFERVWWVWWRPSHESNTEGACCFSGRRRSHRRHL